MTVELLQCFHSVRFWCLIVTVKVIMYLTLLDQFTQTFVLLALVFYAFLAGHQFPPFSVSSRRLVNKGIKGPREPFTTIHMT